MVKRLHDALNRRPVDRVPVWMMRQAGRYLPEYRSSREKAGSFLALCKTPHLACEVSLQPIERFPQLDGVIIFSDILTIPDAMGLGLEFVDHHGPRFRRPLNTATDIDNLAVPDAETDLNYVTRAVAMVSQKLAPEKTMIGFCGSPWTIACYMLANDKQRRVIEAKEFFEREKKAGHKLLSMLAVACADSLTCQIKAGAEVVQIFDTWGAVLADRYIDGSFVYIQRILELLNSNLRAIGLGMVPVLLYTQAEQEHYDTIADSDLTGISVPAARRLSEVRQRWGDRLIIQGNLDPKILTTDDVDQLEHATRRVLEDFGQVDGHIFNLGHGITPDARIDNVVRMLEVIDGPSDGARD